MRTKFIFTFPLFIVFVISCLSAQNNSIYVWDFADRDGNTSDLSTNLTDEFEQALHSTECCKILQRRDYARLFSQRENEAAIVGVRSLSSNAQERLKDIQAEMVAFGELYDDTNSGQFKISVSVENFEGEILKSGSVYMAKYDIHNPGKREDAIEELIDKLRFAPRVTKPTETKEVDEWTFSLTECVRIGKNVRCSYNVISNYRDRQFQLSFKTRAFDDYGYEYRLSSHQLANKSQSGGRSIQTLLIDGVRTHGYVQFDNVSSRALSFPMLEFRVSGDDLSVNTFQFRDVVFE